MGMLVVLEGIDGSGKGTQARLLVDALARRGFTARLFSFPCYDETFFGREVGRYLNGAFGDLHSVPPEFAALLYAGDRLEKRDELLVALRDADVVVCDRYVPSNFAHQAAKLPRERQDALIDWIAAVEYTVFGLPRPDLVCLLTMPPERSVALVLNKNRRSYTEKRLDPTCPEARPPPRPARARPRAHARGVHPLPSRDGYPLPQTSYSCPTAPRPSCP